MLAKAVATECKCQFFSISASSLVSKWMGESEKLMKTLFAVARMQAPSVIFFDEIDSMLTKRSSEGENEAARRLKTEFLVQVDGAGSNNPNAASVLVIGATNRPFDLDEAALRRLTKRIYIDLPDSEARLGAINKLIKQVSYDISDKQMKTIVKSTKGYSFADITALVKDAAMGPIRELQHDPQRLVNMDRTQVRPITIKDFAWSWSPQSPPSLPPPLLSPPPSSPSLCGQTVTGSTSGSSNRIGNAAPDHIYEFCTLARGTHTFNSCGSGFDTWIRVWTQDLSRELFGCDDCGACGTRTILTGELDAGCYQLVIDGFGTSSGSYTVQITCPTA